MHPERKDNNETEGAELLSFFFVADGSRAAAQENETSRLDDQQLDDQQLDDQRLDDQRLDDQQLDDQRLTGGRDLSAAISRTPHSTAYTEPH